MKLLVVCNEIPYPPNHGGRVDVWARLRAFRAAGVSIVLITWCSDRKNERPSQGDTEAVRGIVEVEQCHMIAGGFDYLLKVRTADMETYRAILGEKISSLPHVIQTSTFVVMESVKDLQN